MHLLSVISLAASPLDVPSYMSTLLNKYKGKEKKGNEIYNIWIGSWPKGTTLLMLVGFFCVFI
jgi:hypothetical protein